MDETLPKLQMAAPDGQARHHDVLEFLGPISQPPHSDHKKCGWSQFASDTYS